LFDDADDDDDDGDVIKLSPNKMTFFTRCCTTVSPSFKLRTLFKIRDFVKIEDNINDGETFKSKKKC